MPEKQRKQIEFIDEIYDKIVLNKKDTSDLTLQSKLRNEDKENIRLQQTSNVPTNINLKALDKNYVNTEINHHLDRNLNAHDYAISSNLTGRSNSSFYS